MPNDYTIYDDDTIRIAQPEGGAKVTSGKVLRILSDAAFGVQVTEGNIRVVRTDLPPSPAESPTLAELIQSLRKDVDTLDTELAKERRMRQDNDRVLAARIDRETEARNRQLKEYDIELRDAIKFASERITFSVKGTEL